MHPGFRLLTCGLMNSAEAARPRLLLIDDDRKLCRLITAYLEPLGYEVSAVHSGPEGVERATAEPPWHAIILDLMLPGLDGFEVLKHIRKTSDVPVLMLTARGEEGDRIVGLEIGADDYLPKTFSTRELLARLRAVMRRSGGGLPLAGVEPDLVAGPLRINPGARVATLEERPLDLTAVEFDLLACLLRAKGRVKSREQLLQEIRDRDYEVFDRSIDVHICVLRKKLGDDPKSPRFIRTLRSAGYMLSHSAASTSPMRVRFPISAKILLWFFLNLAIVGVAAYAFLQAEFHLRPEMLLEGRAGRRVDALENLVTGDLNSVPRGQWGSVLARAGNLYGLRLALFSPHRASRSRATPLSLCRRRWRPGCSAPVRPGRGAALRRRKGLLRTSARPALLLLGRIAACSTPAVSTGCCCRWKFPPRGAGAGTAYACGGLRIRSGWAAWCWIPLPGPRRACAVVVFSVLFWLPLVRGMARSIRQVTEATARIAEGRFDIRLTAARADELGQLAQSVNQMAGRLAGFVQGQKRFLGDIAHELCSPLARTQVALGILEQPPGCGCSRRRCRICRRRCSRCPRS